MSSASMEFLIGKRRIVCDAYALLLRKHRGQNNTLHLAAFAHTHVSPLPTAEPSHTSTAREPEGARHASLVCDLLRGGARWCSLDENFNSVVLSDRVVEKVLLQLKEPPDARRALLFFHWCAHRRRLQHGLRSYSLMIHILVRAGMVTDATALLESVVTREDFGGGMAVVEALRSAYELAVPGPRVYDLLLLSFSRRRMFDVAVEACRLLGEHGFLPSLGSFNFLLRAVQRSERFDMVWKIYEHMVVKRRYPNQATTEVMIGTLCKGGMLRSVVDALDKIHGKRCSPNVVVGAALALRMIEEDRAEAVMVLLKRMLQKNLILDDVACSLTVHAYCKMGDLDMARKAFEEMVKRGLEGNSFIYTSLIGRNCMEGRMGDAGHLMQEMQVAGLKPYDKTYNVLIEWSSRMGNSGESLAFCTDMLGRGLLPSRVACHEMMSKLCQDGEVEKANKVFTVLLQKGFVPDEVIYSKLIDGYGKIGNSHEILKLYYEMEGRGPSPGLSAYTSLLRSLCHCGKYKEAERMAASMKQKSIATPEYIHSLLMEHREAAHNV